MLGVVILSAVGVSAFVVSSKDAKKQAPTATKLVWFEVDPSGNPINVNDGREGTNPFGCDQVDDILCARALTYNDDASLSEVELVSTNPDRYKIKTGINILLAYDGTIMKSEE